MSSTSDVVMLARVGGSLVLVLLVALLAARFARRAGVRGGRGTLAVRERVGLSREASAVVLEVGDRLLLLGVSAQQVNVLADLGASGTVVAEPVEPARTAVAALPGSRHTSDIASADVLARAAAALPTQRAALHVVTEPATTPLTRRDVRAAQDRRRQAVPPSRRGTGSALDPRTWQQGLEALRDLTARRS